MLLVGIPGFEPGMTGPESVVLPLHHIPMSFLLLQCHFLIASAKVTLFSEPTKFFSTFFIENRYFFHFYAFFVLNRLVLRHTNLKKTEKLEESNAYSFFCTIFVVE